MQKTLMILGGGAGQIPAIIAANKKRVRTVVLDIDTNAPGMRLADHALPVNLVDIETAVKTALEFKVDGALTLQSDIGVPAVGAIIDKLKLPGNGYQVAMRCSNKIFTRESLAKKGVPQPKFAVAASVKQAVTQADLIGYPCIIKAPDSSGSRGVVKVHAKQNVVSGFEAAMKYSRMGKVLVEECIHGVEMGAQAFSINGKCVCVYVHDDTLSPPPYMVPVGHAFPADLNSEQLAYVQLAVSECIDALHIKDGPSNIDFILDEENIPRIIEVGARIGATCLPELMYYHTGIDWVGAAIDIAVREQPDLKPKRMQACAAHILEAPMDGILSKISIPDALKKNPDLLELEITAKEGQSVSKLRKGTDRIGKIIVKGKSCHDANITAAKLKNSIQFDVKP